MHVKGNLGAVNGWLEGSGGYCRWAGTHTGNHGRGGQRDQRDLEERARGADRLWDGGWRRDEMEGAEVN